MRPRTVLQLATPTLTLTLALSGAVVPASAQPTAAPPIEQLVTRALANAPSLQAKRARIDAAAEALTAADALPDPMIEFEYRAADFPKYTIGTDPGSMLGASYRQDMLSKGRRRSRRMLAQAEILKSRAELAFGETTLATTVRVLYASLFAIDRERETLDAAGELLSMLEATATARYAVGESDQASVLRVQLERSRLGERVADLENDRVAVQAALNRLTNDPPGTPIGGVAALPDSTPPTTTPDGTTELDQSPEIAVRRAEISVAAEKVAQSKADAHPAWNVGAGLFWQGGWGRMATFSVGLELPIWKKRKQLPLIAAAEREQSAAELDLADATAQLHADLLTLMEAWHTADAQVRRYESALLPQNSAALDATRTSYLVGRGEFVSVLDEFRNWIEVRVGLARRQADRYTARVRLEALLAPETAPATEQQAGPNLPAGSMK